MQIQLIDGRESKFFPRLQVLVEKLGDILSE